MTLPKYLVSLGGALVGYAVVRLFLEYPYYFGSMIGGAVWFGVAYLLAWKRWNKMAVTVGVLAAINVLASALLNKDAEPELNLPGMAAALCNLTIWGFLYFQLWAKRQPTPPPIIKAEPIDIWEAHERKLWRQKHGERMEWRNRYGKMDKRADKIKNVANGIIAVFLLTGSALSGFHWWPSDEKPSPKAAPAAVPMASEPEVTGAAAQHTLNIFVGVSTTNPEWIAPIRNCIIEEIKAYDRVNTSNIPIRFVDYSQSYLDIYVVTRPAVLGTTQVGIAGAIVAQAQQSEYMPHILAVTALPNKDGMSFICTKAGEAYMAVLNDFAEDAKNAQ